MIATERARLVRFPSRRDSIRSRPRQTPSTIGESASQGRTQERPGFRDVSGHQREAEQQRNDDRPGLDDP